MGPVIGRWLRVSATAWPVVALAATLSIAAAATPEPDETSARQAVQQGDWPRAIADWHELYIKGDPAAPGELCTLYFGARQGAFEAARVVDWCRKASGNGDAWGLYRMGLLYLAGLGVDRNVDQAQALCAAAAYRDPLVPAGFCLAAAREEKEQESREELRLPRPLTPTATTAILPGGTAAQQCDRAFVTTPFDTAAAAAACGKAAGEGDRQARYRLGLIRLFGVAGPRDLDLAEADCRRAGAAAAPPATDFCLAAAAQLRQAAASLAISRHTGAIDVDPTTGRALPKTDSSPFAADRVLDEPRRTATGLSYNCRQVTQWALFEAPDLSILTPRDTLFGRRVTDLAPGDFAAMDQAAAGCAAATAALDPDGSLAEEFATFRRSLGALKTRQAELRAAQSRGHADAALAAQVDQSNRSSRLTSPASVTPQESACIERVRQAWRASGQSNGRSLEIRDTRMAAESGRLVAYGTANIVNAETVQHDVIAASMFSCTFDHGTGDRVANLRLQPGFSAAR